MLVDLLTKDSSLASLVYVFSKDVRSLSSESLVNGCHPGIDTLKNIDVTQTKNIILILNDDNMKVVYPIKVKVTQTPKVGNPVEFWVSFQLPKGSWDVKERTPCWVVRSFLLSFSLEMPKKVKCCVPGCGNNYKTQGPLHFYRIPKDVDMRNAYRLLLRNKCVRLDSENTRICSAHFESGIKLSRCHLPNVFPWNYEEDKKTGEKRRNLEQIASILKIKRAKNELSDEQLQDPVQSYQYHVPWRFDGFPLYHGVVSSFKTTKEHEQHRTISVSNAEEQTISMEIKDSRINDNTHNMSTHSVPFHQVSTADIPYVSVNNMNMIRTQNTDSRQMPKVSLTPATSRIPSQQSLSYHNNWQIRQSYTHTAPSTSTLPGPFNQGPKQLSLTKAGTGNQILHVDQNFFQPGVVTSNKENGFGVQILNDSQTSLVNNNIDLLIESRKLPAVKNNVLELQDKLESHQSQAILPFGNGNAGQTLSDRVSLAKIYKESGSQTDVSEEDFQQLVQRMNRMRFESRNLKEEVEMLKKKLMGFENVPQRLRFSIKKICNKELLFYTGFENLETLMMYSSIVKESAKSLPIWGKILNERLLREDVETDEELSILGELTLLFMKVKLNLHDTDLAFRFVITENKVQSVVYTWLQIYYAFSSGSTVYQQLPESIKSGLRLCGIE